jgi:hypothetical protein
VDGIDIGNAEAPGREQLILVGGAARLRGPERRGARRVDDALDGRAQAFLEHGLRPAYVDVEEPLHVRGPEGPQPRGVKDALHALERPAHRAPIQDVAGDPLHVEVADQLVVGSVLHGQAQVVAAFVEKPRDV